MSKTLNLKSRTNLILTLAVVIVFLCSGILIVTYHKKLDNLKAIEDSFTNRLRDLEILEGRVGSLHKRISRSLIRKKRSTVFENSTDFAQNDMTDGIKNDVREGYPCNVNCGDAVGTVYTRWGRKTCNNESSELIYEGIVGGSWFEHDGAAVNPLCLPKQPLWNRYTDDLNSYAYMFETEFRTLFFR